MSSRKGKPMIRRASRPERGEMLKTRMASRPSNGFRNE